MKIFVTGATGFVGTHFVEIACRKGWSIVGHRRRESSAVKTTASHEVKWVTKPLSDVSPKDLMGVECLVHLAAHTANIPYDTLEACIHWNVSVPISLFRIAKSVGISKIVVAGSCFEYGRSGARYEFIPPCAPLEPIGTYPVSKAMASVAFCRLASELNLELSIHRIFQVFGPGESERRLWPSLRDAALQGKDYPMTFGEQIRDFVPVEIVASKLLYACVNSFDVGRTWIENIGTGNPQSVLSFSQHWWRHWNATGRLLVGDVPYRKDEVMRFVPELDTFCVR